MRAVVDRIEEGMAILETEGGATLEVPMESLPWGVHEGTVLEIAFRIDEEEERRRRKEAEQLQRKLRDEGRR